MRSRLLVFGGSGQLGRALIDAARCLQCEVTGLSRAEADICEPGAVGKTIRVYQPTIIVNAAAYTGVDSAESEEPQAFRVNRDGARVVAEAAASADIPLIHISTNYVFDGRNAVPYTELDEVRPLGVYGRSKEEGESVVRSSARKHVILRTAWVFSPYGTNFVRTMLRLGSKREELRIVDDQTGSPTSASDIASAILKIAGMADSSGFERWGTYHCAGADIVTRYAFASMIFEEAAELGMKAPRLRPITTADYPGPAPRPAYSALDTKKLEDTFGIRPRPLRTSLVACLKRLVEHQGSRT